MGFPPPSHGRPLIPTVLFNHHYDRLLISGVDFRKVPDLLARRAPFFTSPPAFMTCSRILPDEHRNTPYSALVLHWPGPAPGEPLASLNMVGADGYLFRTGLLKTCRTCLFSSLSQYASVFPALPAAGHWPFCINGAIFQLQ